MATESFGGWRAGLSFIVLAILTTLSALLGAWYARNGKVLPHRAWMARCFSLLCSAIVLRVFGGLTIMLRTDPEYSYVLASWASWILPLLVCETMLLTERHQWLRRLGIRL